MAYGMALQGHGAVFDVSTSVLPALTLRWNESAGGNRDNPLFNSRDLTPLFSKHSVVLDDPYEDHEEDVNESSY